MKSIFNSKEKSIVKFEKDDECLTLLAKLAKERDASFHFSMIGGVSSVEIAFFDMNKKEYISKIFSPGFSGNIEVVSVTGNVAWFEGNPMVHAHGIFSNEKYECFGGHVIKMAISITGETIIHWLPEKIEREFDADSCLKLLTINKK